MSVFVIAEAGSCHDGDLAQALALIEAARDAGADACKFQYWSDADTLANRRRVPPAYRAIYRRYRLPASWLQPLAAACAATATRTRGCRPIEFMCSTYVAGDIATVAPFVRRFKVASFEALDRDFLLAHGLFLRSKDDLIISTGMMNQYEAYEASGFGRILHCISAYPAPIDSINLSALLHHDDADGLESIPEFDGLSDHSRHPLVGALATAAGAAIIEAHLRLDDTNPQNPDYATAFTPAEFAEYVSHIRFAEHCMGSGEKRLQDCEREMARFRVRNSADVG